MSRNNNNAVVTCIENTISAMEALSADPKTISPMHPARNMPRWTEMLEQLEAIRAEMVMVSWKQLFSVPERRIIITVPEYVAGLHGRVAALERYLCANSALDECVALDPATLQPEKLYSMSIDVLNSATTFTISHKSHMPQLSVITDYDYHRLPANSDEWQTTLTYYCSFIDEEPEFIKDDLMMESEVSTNDCD